MLKVSKCDDEKKGYDAERRQNIKDRDLLKINKCSNNDRCNYQIEKGSCTTAQISNICHVRVR